MVQFMVRFSSNYQLRRSIQFFFSVPAAYKSTVNTAFMFKAPPDWNNRPVNIRAISSFTCSKMPCFCIIRSVVHAHNNTSIIMFYNFIT